MHRAQELVRVFHKCMGIPFSEYPMIRKELCPISLDLIEEEVHELRIAYKQEEISLKEVADALGDILYVVYGAAERHGLDMEPIFNEIHRSNMTKVGGKFSSKGKFLKPPTYSPPNLEYVVNKLREKALLKLARKHKDERENQNRDRDQG